LAHAAWLAWSLWALAIVLAALLVLFFLVSLSAWGEIPDRAPPWFVPLMALMLVSFSTVGAVVAARRPENAVGWSLLAIGFALGVAFAAQSYADYTSRSPSSCRGSSPMLSSPLRSSPLSAFL
jgi:heme/copper-type cytochrome/quinol oxidase subunit 3